MTFAMRNVSTAAGLWLRCFLGRALGISLLCFVASGVLNAQLEVAKPLRLTHVEGFVVNSFGKPVVNAEVTLVRDETVAFSTRTDGTGEFHIDHVSGRYEFRVARTEYAPAAREVTVSDEIVTHLERKKLYVIVGPGACTDACSSIYTSKREFEREIRKRKKN